MSMLRERNASGMVHARRCIIPLVNSRPALEFRPDDPDFIRDPFPLFKRMREEDPVHWSPRIKSWVLTRYDDVKAVCLDKDISSDRLRPFFASLPGPEAERIRNIIQYLSHWMVFRDPPEHTRLRRLTSKVFHLQSMNAMRPDVESLVEWLFERIGAQSNGASVGHPTSTACARDEAHRNDARLWSVSTKFGNDGIHQ